MMHINKSGGCTYFERWGFSINEGQFPNVHMSWRDGHFWFYVGLCEMKEKAVRFCFGFRLPFTICR